MPLGLSSSLQAVAAESSSISLAQGLRHIHLVSLQLPELRTLPVPLHIVISGNVYMLRGFQIHSQRVQLTLSEELVFCVCFGCCCLLPSGSSLGW